MPKKFTPPDDVTINASVEWTAPEDDVAAQGENKDKVPRFRIEAYNGGAVEVGWGELVAFDLSGMNVDQRTPIYLNHTSANIVGHSTQLRKTESTLRATGVVSAMGYESADFVRDTSARGFPWQASVGLRVKRTEYIENGAKATVNGNTVKGPAYVVRESKLNEISFVPRGADGSTSATVAASQQGEKMRFTDWAKSKGYDVSAASGAQINAWMALWEADIEAGDAPADKTPAEPAKKPQATPKAAAASTPTTPTAPLGIHAGQDQPPVDDPYTGIIQANARAARRIEHVRELAAGNETIIASALEDEASGKPWSDTNLKNAVALANKRDGRPAPPTQTASDRLQSNKVLEAAVALQQAGDVRESVAADISKKEGDQVLELADKMSGIGLRGALEVYARANGEELPDYYMGRQAYIQAASSMVNLPNMFVSVCKRTLDSLYDNEPAIGPSCSRNGSAPDFRKVTRFRLDGGEPWKEIQEDGKLAHQSYGKEIPREVQMSTYGAYLVFKRHDVINDDLGAISQVTEMMARGANTTLDMLFLRLVYSKAIFNVGNANVTQGAAAALNCESLRKAKQDMLCKRMDVSDKHQKTRRVRANKLLYGCNLQSEVDKIFGAQEIEFTEGSKTIKIANPFGGIKKQDMLELGNPTMAPSAVDTPEFYAPSDDAWLLLTNPTSAFAPVEYTWLNGRRTPTVERSNLNGDCLGFSIRAYLDAGVNPLDPCGWELFLP